MITSRRLALVTAAMSLGLLTAGCGDDPGSTSAGLPKISLTAGGSGNAEMAASDGAARLSMAYWGDITYVYDGTLPDLGATAAAYRFPAGVTPDLDKVADIAATLGVEGEVAQQAADMGGGWMAGPADYSGPTLTVGSDGLLSWWYSNPSAYGGEVCAEPAVIDPPATSEGTTAPDGGDDAAASRPAELCAAPEPPANVPNGDEATALATELFESLGVNTESLEWEVYADDWGASVTAFSLVGGVRSPLAWSAGYGGEGELTWASGTLATAEDVGEYPIVSAAEGVERLNDETRMWQWFGGGMAFAARDTGAVGMVGATEGVAVQGTSDAPMAVTVGDDGSVSSGSGTVVSGSVVVESIVPEPAPDASTPILISPAPTEPEPITITLTSVELGLTQVWDADGTVWMLPAFVFGSVDSGDITVIAVADDYLDIPEVPMPEPMPEPLPVETVPGELVDPMADAVDLAEAAALLVGLAEADAVDLAARQGWTVRVVRLDGEDLAATMDYSPTRVNVAVDGGVVTEAVSIG